MNGNLNPASVTPNLILETLHRQTAQDDRYARRVVDWSATHTMNPGQILVGGCLDNSLSMINPFNAELGKSRWEMLVESALTLMKNISNDPLLRHRVRIFLTVFNSKIEPVVIDEPIYSLDLKALGEQLRAMEPNGVTRLGDCIVQTVNTLMEVKERMGTLCSSQPICVVFTDGQPTDLLGYEDESSMDEAYALCDGLQKRRKLLLLPAAIGRKGAKADDFPALIRLVQESTVECSVITDLMNLRRYFIFLERTIIDEVSAAAHAVPADAAAHAPAPNPADCGYANPAPKSDCQPSREEIANQVRSILRNTYSYSVSDSPFQ